ncbi:glycosyltransferase family 4 protein [Gammaproteobacteria bacterium]|nr:glycosyltransferase family 4 protein [Gammaproteobacteria bacterium]MDB9859544.1 glycosyltransferase family 4 protein [Gammaproteobacteria bacterium]MDB9940067.1 glycosyltransferase family 4 protein [Gammaproteobacteria bacterium]
MKKLKILFLQPYPTGQAAGQRFKVEQAYEFLKKTGHQVTINSFFDIGTWNILHKKKNLFKKFFNTLYLWLKRLSFILFIHKYDVVYVFMWVTPRGYPVAEWWVRKFSKKLIIDIDDEVYKVDDLNFFSSFLSCKPKSKYLVQRGNVVLHNSPSSAQECRNLNEFSNAIHVPCSFDMSRYKKKLHSKKDLVTLGWTGTFSSIAYLKILEPVLKDLYDKKKFNITLITNFDYQISGLDVNVIPWRKDTEIEDLLNFDIGIYPVFFDDWSKSKGGLKVQQYMSMGLPSVSTNHGAATSYIDHGVTGFLAENNQDWSRYLLDLMNDFELRAAMGNAARDFAEKNFSIDSSLTNYNKIFTED